MAQFRKQLFSSGRLPYRFKTLPITLFLCALLSAFGLSWGTADGAMDLADEPMLAKFKAAPANIMFLLDDSGSMTFEVLVAGYSDGNFPNPGLAALTDYSYIFDYLGDNAVRDPSGNLEEFRFMGTEGRKYWRSQYFKTNVMYYNPAATYEPWPGYPGQTFSDADMNEPLPHPLKKDTERLKLNAVSFKVVQEGASNLDVRHAHYFIEAANGKVYLVVINGVEKKIVYYQVTRFDKGSGMAQKVKRVRLETSPPADVITGRTYREERRNFANWFTYHRRREYVAKSAIARVINNLQGVRVGILGINGTIIVPLKPVGVWKDGDYKDETTALLEKLYAYDSGGGTPLKEGLNNVGKYYSNLLKDKDYEGNEPPYYTDVEGGACQQSFTIIVTDGYYSDVNYRPLTGNADGDKNSIYDGGFYGDKLSDTLADIAMYYYENDLSDEDQGGLQDLVYDEDRLHKSAIDTAPHQHMVTYGVAFGVIGNLNPDEYNDDPASENFLKDANGNYPNWPSSIPEQSKETIDDLYHATVNGRGDFLTAKDPQELADSLLELMNSILDRLGSAAAVSINGDNLYGRVSDNVLMFQASYKTNDWSGDVKAYRVDAVTGKVLLGDPRWSAADSLETQVWSDRNILTYNGSGGVEFDPGETSIDRNILGIDRENIINYVRGNKDIPNFRVRNKLLGDIVHSSPVFENNFVYVGANDGMLHAFEITVTTVAGKKEVNGEEKFAYVPSFVYENLANLTETAMAHKFFVDLTPTVVKGEKLLDGRGDETILVGGLGKGGKGYFALNITNPTTVGPGQILWEFPNDATGDEMPDMGYSFSKPLVVQTNSEAWVVITGNGYDSENGRAVLYLLNPVTGAITKKISTRDTDSDNGLSSPIAVDVNFDRKVDFVYAGDLKGNMWKFDLTGENSSEWSVAYHDGANRQPLFRAKDTDGSPQPITTKPEVMFHPEEHGLMVLFGTGKFLGMSDFTDDRVQSVYGIWDYGDRAYFQGTWGDYSNDDDSEFLGSFNRPHLSNHMDKDVTLLAQTSTIYSTTIIDENNEAVDIKVRVMSSDTPTWETDAENPAESNGKPNLPDLSDKVANHAGWNYDLPLTGEKVISDVLLRDGRLIVISFRPNEDHCSDGGSSILMELNSFTGGTPGGAIFDINNDGKIDGGDLVTPTDGVDNNTIGLIPVGLQLSGNVQPPAILLLNPKIEIKYLSSSTGAVHMIKEKAVRLGVTYWKELDN